MTLRSPGTELHDRTLGQGLLAVGRAPAGGLCVVDEPARARASFCTDRRGTWLVVGDGVRGVHVNGRPVQRRAVLRAGDTVHVDGVEIALVGATRAAPEPPPAGAAHAASDADPRRVLRGISGPHHGRSLTFARPRLVGRDPAADIRIDTLEARHAQLALENGQPVVRALSAAEVRVNGRPVSSAVLRPGDQVAFDAHHRFVLESPAPAPGVAVDGVVAESNPPPEVATPDAPHKLRVPWLLLTALLIAAALAALLLL